MEVRTPLVFPVPSAAAVVAFLVRTVRSAPSWVIPPFRVARFTRRWTDGSSGDGVRQKRRHPHRLSGRRERPFDLVFVPGLLSHLDLLWEEGTWSQRFFTRLASF